MHFARLAFADHMNRLVTGDRALAAKVAAELENRLETVRPLTEIGTDSRVRSYRRKSFTSSGGP
jgi:hypothetical protein